MPPTWKTKSGKPKERRDNLNKYKDSYEEYIKSREKLEKKIKEITEMMKRGDYFKAMEEADKVIKKYNSIRAKLIKVKALGLTGNIVEAEKMAKVLEKEMYHSKRGKLYTTMIQIYREIKDTKKIREMEEKIIKNGLLDHKAATAIVKAYATSFETGEMERFFEIVKERKMVDPFIISAIIDGYTKTRQFKKVVEIFNEYPIMRNVGVYTTFIKAMLIWGSKEAKRLATDAFNEAKKLGEIDEKLYGTYMRVVINNIKLCEELYREAEERLNNKAQLMRYLMKVYLEAGNFEKAEKIYEEIEQRKGPDIRGLFILFKHYADSKNIKKAENLFNRMRRITEKANRPMNTMMDAYIFMFNMYLKVGNVENAKAIVNLFLSRYGYNSRVIKSFMRYAINYPEIHSFMIDLFKEVEEHGYTTLPIYSNVILLLGLSKRIEEAEEVFRKVKNDKHHFLLFRMAEAYLANNMYEKALDILNKIEINDGKNEETFNEFKRIIEMWVYANRGEKNKIHEMFNEMKKREEQNIMVLNELMRVYASLNDKVGVDKVFKYISKYEVYNMKTFTIIMDFYGELGDIRKVKRIFSEAKKSKNADELTYNMFFNILYKNGFYEEISTYYNNAPRWIRDIPIIVIRYANAKRKMGQRELSISIIDKFLKSYRFRSYMDPVFISALVTKAYALKDIGKIREAREIFKEIIKNTNKNNPIYPTAVVGYVFSLTKKEDSIIKLSLLMDELNTFLSNGRGKKEDVERAIKHLSMLINQ